MWASRGSGERMRERSKIGRGGRRGCAAWVAVWGPLAVEGLRGNPNVSDRGRVEGAGRGGSGAVVVGGACEAPGDRYDTPDDPRFHQYAFAVPRG
jgi:hypothetical protein